MISISSGCVNFYAYHFTDVIRKIATVVALFIV